MNIKPIADKVIVQRLEDLEKTPGGLFIPQNSAERERMNRGTVVAVNDTYMLDGVEYTSEVKVGDEVFFGYEMADINLGDKKFFVMRHANIQAIIDNSAE